MRNPFVLFFRVFYVFPNSSTTLNLAELFSATVGSVSMTVSPPKRGIVRMFFFFQDCDQVFLIAGFGMGLLTRHCPLVNSPLIFFTPFFLPSRRERAIPVFVGWLFS